jgi:hypothetical protein
MLNKKDWWWEIHEVEIDEKTMIGRCNEKIPSRNEAYLQAFDKANKLSNNK